MLLSIRMLSAFSLALLFMTAISDLLGQLAFSPWAKEMDEDIRTIERKYRSAKSDGPSIPSPYAPGPPGPPMPF